MPQSHASVVVLRSTGAILLALVLLALSGCGEKLPEAYPVAGKVLYRGQPAVGVMVTLAPENNPAAEAALAKSGWPSALTGTDGTFKISTFAEFDGAPPGSYALLLSWPKYDTSDPEESEPQLVDLDQLRGQYADPAKTTFKVTVANAPVEVPPCELK